MNKVYTRINWENYPSLVTPINEQNLNKLDFATDSLDNRIINLDTAKVNVTDIQQNIANWTMDEETGIITITRVNGDTITFDLNIEKIPVNFELTDEGILIMTTDDGTQFKADIASMIPVLTFNSSSEIKVTATGTGINKTYTFSIIDNSITEDKLEANYLANIKEETAKAEASSNASSEASANANNYATLSKSWAIGGTGTRDDEDSNNAKYYAEQARQIGQSIINDTNTTSTTTTFSASNISNLTNTEADSTVMTRIEETTENDLTTLNASYSNTIDKKLNNYISSITGFLTQIVNSYNSLVTKVKSLLSVIGTSTVPTINGATTLTGLMYKIALYQMGTLANGTDINKPDPTSTLPYEGVYHIDRGNSYVNLPSNVTKEQGILETVIMPNAGYYLNSILQTYASKSGIYMRYGTSTDDWEDWVKLGTGTPHINSFSPYITKQTLAGGATSTYMFDFPTGVTESLITSIYPYVAGNVKYSRILGYNIIPNTHIRVVVNNPSTTSETITIGVYYRYLAV